MRAKERHARHKAGELLFKEAELRGVDLCYAQVRRICLDGAEHTGAKRVNTDWADADVRYGRLDGAGVHDANLAGSIRDGRTTEGADRWSVFP